MLSCSCAKVNGNRDLRMTDPRVSALKICILPKEQADPRWRHEGIRPCRPTAGAVGDSNLDCSTGQHKHARLYSTFFYLQPCTDSDYQLSIIDHHECSVHLVFVHNSCLVNGKHIAFASLFTRDNYFLS